jgi:hypothetical protein
MKRSIIKLLSCALVLLSAGLLQAQPYTVSSPDRSIQVQIGGDEQLQYFITFAGNPVLEKSALGFAFRDEPDLQKGLQVIKSLVTFRVYDDGKPLKIKTAKAGGYVARITITN